MKKVLLAVAVLGFASAAFADPTYSGSVTGTGSITTTGTAVAGSYVNGSGFSAEHADMDSYGHSTVGGSVNAAVANFAKGLSKLGMRDGVNVNVIHPGNTATERQEELLAQRAAATGKTVEELRAAALAKSGARRVGKVDGGGTVGYY